MIGTFFTNLTNVLAWSPKQGKFATDLKGSNFAPDSVMASSITGDAGAQLLQFNFSNKKTINAGVLMIESVKLWAGESLEKAEQKNVTDVKSDASMFSDKYDIVKRNEAAKALFERLAVDNGVMKYETVDEALYNKVKDASMSKADGENKPSEKLGESFKSFQDEQASYKKGSSGGLGKKIAKGNEDYIKTCFDALAMEKIEIQLSKLDAQNKDAPYVVEVMFVTNLPTTTMSVTQSKAFVFDGTKYKFLKTTKVYEEWWFNIIILAGIFVLLVISIYFGGSKSGAKPAPKKKD